MVSLAEKQRQLKDVQRKRGAREKFDQRVMVYLQLSERLRLELIAEERGESLCNVLRGLIRLGQQAVESDG